MDIGNYRLKTIPLNIVLLERNKKGNYRDIGFYSTPAQALDALVDREVLGTGLKDLETVTEKQNELYRLIQQLAPSSV